MSKLLIILGIGFIIYKMWEKGYKPPWEKDVFEEPKPRPWEKEKEEGEEEPVIYPNPFN